MRFLLLLLAIPLHAATWTPILPTQHAGEVDLSVIVQPYEAQGFQRIPDDLDLMLPVDGYAPLYLVAFEDYADFDFNDFVVLFDSVAGTFDLVATYAGNRHELAYLTTGMLMLNVTGGCCPGGPFWSSGGPDRMVTWSIPVTPPSAVPEPGTVALLGVGLLLAAAWRKR